MNQIQFFLLFICLFVALSSAVDTPVTFNNTRGPDCAFPLSCSFLDPSLWVPAGPPNATNAVSIDSPYDLQLVVESDHTANLTSLVLQGNVTIEVRGILQTFPKNLFNASLVLCDHSRIHAVGSGVFVGRSIRMYDASSLQISDNAFATLNQISFPSPNTTIACDGGAVSFAGVDGSGSLILSGTAVVSGDIRTGYFSISDSVRANINIGVYNKGYLNGPNYLLNYLDVLADGVVEINSCPHINYIYCHSGTIILEADNCNLPVLDLYGSSRFAVVGHSNFTVGSIFGDAPATVTFAQPPPSPSPSVSFVNLSNTLRPVNLMFEGTYQAVVGHEGGALNFYLASLAVNGHLDLYVQNTVATNGFQVNENTTLVIPANTTFSIQNNSFIMDQQSSSILWQPYGQVMISEYGNLVAPSLHLDNGRAIGLAAYGSGAVNVATGAFVVGEGGYLRVYSTSTVTATNVSVFGALVLRTAKPTNLTINGNLVIQRTGFFTVTHTLLFATERVFPFLVQVNGDLNIVGGTLNVSLEGVDISTMNLTSIPIPLVKADRIVGDFESFLGAKLLDSDKQLFYNIDNNTLWLHFGPAEDTPSNIEEIIIFCASAAGGVLVIVGIVVVILYRREKKGYQRVN